MADVPQHEAARILERLEQQDKTAIALAANVSETARVLATRVLETSELLARDFRVHTDADADMFESMDTKLAALLEYQTKQKGAIATFMTVAGAFAAVVGWVISIFMGKS